MVIRDLFLKLGAIVAYLLLMIIEPPTHPYVNDRQKALNWEVHLFKIMKGKSQQIGDNRKGS